MATTREPKYHPLAKWSKRPRLTRRQNDVLPLIAQGMSTKEIARQLNISEGTTKIHTAALLRAIGARNRTEAAFIAAKLVGSRETSNDCPPQSIQTSQSLWSTGLADLPAWLRVTRGEYNACRTIVRNLGSQAAETACLEPSTPLPLSGRVYRSNYRAMRSG